MSAFPILAASSREAAPAGRAAGEGLARPLAGPGVGLEHVLEARRPARGWAAMTSAMVSGIAVKGMRSSRKAATASSLAALRTAGREPPARQRAVGEAQAREALVVGHVEVEPQAAR